MADYNQIELRVIAHLAQDPGLIEAFATGQDIHKATAARLFSVDPEEVTLGQRSKAKMVSYGLAYGMESFGLGQRLGIPTEEAALILGAYFEAFPSVRAYMERTVVEARDRGYTETLFGRRRQIPELQSQNYRLRQAGERQAMNAGIQGLAADIFKVALVRLDRALEQLGLASRLVLQVHDEVILEVPPAEEDERRRRHPRSHARRRRAERPPRGQPRLGRHLGHRQGLTRPRPRTADQPHPHLRSEWGWRSQGLAAQLGDFFAQGFDLDAETAGLVAHRDLDAGHGHVGSLAHADELL